MVLVPPGRVGKSFCPRKEVISRIAVASMAGVPIWGSGIGESSGTCYSDAHGYPSSRTPSFSNVGQLSVLEKHAKEVRHTTDLAPEQLRCSDEKPHKVASSTEPPPSSSGL